MQDRPISWRQWIVVTSLVFAPSLMAHKVVTDNDWFWILLVVIHTPFVNPIIVRNGDEQIRFVMKPSRYPFISMKAYDFPLGSHVIWSATLIKRSNELLLNEIVMLPLCFPPLSGCISRNLFQSLKEHLTRCKAVQCPDNHVYRSVSQEELST